MNVVLEFLNNYGLSIAYALLTAIGGFIGIKISRIFDTESNEKEKARIVKYVINAVEQLYTDLDGEDKKNKAIEYVAEMLNNKGIAITDLEISLMIESAVREMNNQYKSEKNSK